MKKKFDVIVIGAGITGASAAYYLKINGVQNVLLIEKGSSPACSNTGRSAAIVRTFYTSKLMTRIAKSAVDLFSNFSDEIGGESDFNQTGFVQIMPKDWVDTAKDLIQMHQDEGIDTQIIDPKEYEKRFPWINTEGIGLILFETRSGYADPVKTTQSFVDEFINMGGEVLYKTPCRSLTSKKHKITGVILDDGFISCEKVINAAGPWSKFLAESIGLELPLRSLREQDTIIESKSKTMPTTPLSNAIEPTYMRPLNKNSWLIGRGFPKPYYDVDAYNYKQTLDDGFSKEVLELMGKRIPALKEAKVVGGYAALYDVTPDWMPFFGPRDGMDGYYDASGGSGHAFKTGPILSKELVEWALNNNVNSDFRQLSFDRIKNDNLFVSIFGGNRC